MREGEKTRERDRWRRSSQGNGHFMGDMSTGFLRGRKVRERVMRLHLSTASEALLYAAVWRGSSPPSSAILQTSGSAAISASITASGASFAAAMWIARSPSWFFAVTASG